MELFTTGAGHAILALLLASNLIAFILMGIDKAKARNGAWRIPERTLFLFPVLGGAIGGCCGMYLFRHKTKHWYFAFFFPLFAAVQTTAFIYLAFFR